MLLKPAPRYALLVHSMQDPPLVPARCQYEFSSQFHLSMMHRYAASNIGEIIAALRTTFLERWTKYR